MATVILIALLLAGLVVAGFFLVSSRPAHPFRWESVSANGLIYVIVLWYVRSLVVLGLRHWRVRWDGAQDTVTSLGLLLLIDLILVARLMSWRRYSRSYNAASARIQEEGQRTA